MDVRAQTRELPAAPRRPPSPAPPPLSAKNFCPAFASVLIPEGLCLLFRLCLAAAHGASCPTPMPTPTPELRTRGWPATSPSAQGRGNTERAKPCRCSGRADGTEFIITFPAPGVREGGLCVHCTSPATSQALLNRSESSCLPEVIKPPSLKGRDAELDSSDMRCDCVSLPPDAGSPLGGGGSLSVGVAETIAHL